MNSTNRPTRTTPPLVTQLIPGDSAAFTLLLQRHNRKLYTYCLKMLGDRESACEVMKGVWKRFGEIRGIPQNPENASSLLMNIVRGHVLDYLRDRRTHLPIETIRESQHGARAKREPTYTEDLVVKALDRLPLPQRETIILNTYSGYDRAEIARMMDLPPESIRMRVHRGRAHLARIMGAMLAVEDERVNCVEPPLRSTKEGWP